jgi:phage portal protein BeeE
MDFMSAKNGARARSRSPSGVPPLLLGLPGDNTHANYAEANRAFYRQTVIPLVRRTAEALAHWLSPAWGRGRDA